MVSCTLLTIDIEEIQLSVCQCHAYGYSFGTRLTKNWEHNDLTLRVSWHSPIFNPMPPKAAVVGWVGVVGYRRGSCQTESPYWRHYAETDDVEMLWQELKKASWRHSLYLSLPTTTMTTTSTMTKTTTTTTSTTTKQWRQRRSDNNDGNNCRCRSRCCRHRRHDWRRRSLSINPVAISILVPAKPVRYPTHYWHLVPVKCQQEWFYRKLQIFIGHHPHNHVHVFGLLTT